MASSSEDSFQVALNYRVRVNNEFSFAFRQYNRHSLWMFVIFCLTSLSVYCLDMQLAVAEFPDNIPVHCNITELEANKWSFREIMSFSKPKKSKECVYYDYNYKLFINKTYMEAIRMQESSEMPNVMKCNTAIISPFERRMTMQREFHYLCSYSELHVEIATITYLGFASGNLLGGIAADTYGRRSVNFTCYLLWLIGLVGLCHVPDATMFKELIFVSSFGGIGCYLASFLTFLEICKKDYRGFYMTVWQFSGCLGVFSLSIYRGYIADWRRIQYVPESPKWLLSCGERKRAWKLLRDLGCSARVLFMTDETPSFCGRKAPSAYIRFITVHLKKLLFVAAALKSVIDFLHTRSRYVGIQKELVASESEWIVLYAETLGCLLVLPPLYVFGRRIGSSVLFMLLAFSYCISTVFVDFHILVRVLLVCVTQAYCIHILINFYVCELFPTFCRGTAVGIVNSCGCLSRIAALHSVQIGFAPLPLEWFLFSLVLSAFASGIVLLLPETCKVELPE